LEAFLYFVKLILLFVGLPIGLGLLLYFVPKKLGYPKTGKYLTILYGLFILTIFTTTAFDELFFTKNDAKNLIEEQAINLTEKFELENYKSASIFDDFYHVFTLKISETDRLKIIQQIKNSDDYKKLGEPTTDFLFYHYPKRFVGPEEKQNYETEKDYVREYFKPNGQGYAPTFKRISVDKKENKLTFEEF
jgi:hypothetical protein